MQNVLKQSLQFNHIFIISFKNGGGVQRPNKCHCPKTYSSNCTLTADNKLNRQEKLSFFQVFDLNCKKTISHRLH